MIPQAMRNLPNWVLWRLEDVGKTKKTKVPYCAKTGLKAASTNPETWCGFQEAVSFYESDEKWAGIGFVFDFNAGLIGIDIDNCLNGDRAPKSELSGLIAKIGETYTEVSPSGMGLHIIGRGRIIAGKKTDQFEAYSEGRYFTITGDVCGQSCDVQDIQAGVNAIIADTIKPAVDPDVDPQAWKLINIIIDPTRSPPLDKYEALKEADKRFSQTVERKRADMKDSSPSAYDMSLAAITVIADWTDQEIADLLVYHRKKWGDDIKRLDYFQRTIFTARRSRKVDKALDALPVMDSEDKSEALSSVRLISGLPIKRIVQEGRTNSHWSLIFDDSRTRLFGGTEQVWKKNEWINIAIEEGAGIPKITPKQWPGFIRAINAIKEVVHNEDVEVVNKINNLLENYLSSKMETIPTDSESNDAVDINFLKSKPVVIGDVLHISASSFLNWIKLMSGNNSVIGVICVSLKDSGYERKTISRRINGKVVTRSYYCKAINR
jgi:hypothetical protein